MSGRPVASVGGGGRPPGSGPRRGVVSYVRRTTRLNDTQQHAWDRFADAWVVPFAEGPRATSVAADAEPLDLPRLFGRSAPLVVEIGSGSGESLVALAEQRPEVDVLALEVYQPAVASTLSRAHRAGVGNVRVVMADAVGALQQLLTPGSVSELLLLFPDPWPKLKHRKRRILTPAFADLVASRMPPGAVWRLATDWQHYADQMLSVLTAHPGWTNLHPDWAPRPEDRPVSKFEAKGTERGRVIRDLAFRRAG